MTGKMPVPPKEGLLRADALAMTVLAIHTDDFRIKWQLRLGIDKNKQIIINLITLVKFVVDKRPFPPELENV